MFARLRSLKDLTRLPDEPVGGKDTYVFEGTDRSGRFKVRHFIDKDTGILRKMVTKNETYESEFVWERTEIEFDVELPEGRFVFTPPKDVEIKDLTTPKVEQAPSPPTP